MSARWRSDGGKTMDKGFFRKATGEGSRSMAQEMT